MDDAFGGQQSIDTSVDLAEHKQADFRILLIGHERSCPHELLMRLPPERQVLHEIKVEDGAKPPSRPLLRMSRNGLDKVQKQLDVPLLHGLIEPSNSPYDAPVFIINPYSAAQSKIDGIVVNDFDGV